jgi:hypothetical protein
MPRYRESPAFSKEESLAINLAVEMAKVPVEPPPEFLNELRRCFDEGAARRAGRGHRLGEL